MGCGKPTILLADTVDGANDLAAHEAALEPGEFQRKLVLRTAARTVMVKLRNDQALRKALLRQNRVVPYVFNVGDYVYYFREDKPTRKPKQPEARLGEYKGPAVVIGFEGNNVWVSMAGRRLLCPKEHLRPAEDDELGVAFDKA